MYTPYTVMDAVQEKVEFIEIKSEFFLPVEFIKNKVYFFRN